MKENKTNGVRRLLIYGFTRQQLIDFVKRKDSFYNGTSFAGHSDEQLRELALRIDNEVQADRQRKKQKQC